MMYTVAKATQTDRQETHCIMKRCANSATENLFSQRPKPSSRFWSQFYWGRYGVKVPRTCSRPYGFKVRSSNGIVTYSHTAGVRSPITPYYGDRSQLRRLATKPPLGFSANSPASVNAGFDVIISRYVSQVAMYARIDSCGRTHRPKRAD